MSAEVVSVQVGSAAPLRWRDGVVASAIVKTPVGGRVALGPLGLAGDEQADLSVHGGPDKAVCAYPVEHREVWEEGLGASLPPGGFGENVALRGLVESDAHIGDVFSVGTATLQVSQPRGPCFKLAARWGQKQLPALMARLRLSGFYFRVLEPGEIGAGDALVPRDRVSTLTVAEVMRVTYVDRRDAAAIERALAVPELAAQWRDALVALSRKARLPLEELGAED